MSITLTSAAVVHLAEAPQTAPTGVSTTVGLSGATLLGLCLVVYIVAKWKSWAKEQKKTFILGVLATTLIGTWGLFGIAHNTIQQTGENTGQIISTVGSTTANH